MAQPYVGEIRMFAGNFAPAGWMFCEGQLLPISENETLFNLIGTTYGGDGQSTFALPDLRGRVPRPPEPELPAGPDRRRRNRHADGESAPDAHAPAPGVDERRAGYESVGQDGRTGRQRVVLHPGRDRHEPECTGDHDGRRQPAARQLPAVSLYQLHHFAVRDLPVAELEGARHMSDQFLAEIRIFPFNFPPTGWAWCDGQLLPLSQNTALFSLLGTTYGGDGKSNFALPDLQGRCPMHPGQGPGLSLHDLGETGGSETVTLLESEIPSHSHAMRASTDPANAQIPNSSV